MTSYTNASSETSNSNTKENTRRNKKTQALSALLSATALGVFLEGCGGGDAPASAPVLGSESNPFVATADANTFTGSAGADWVSYANAGATEGASITLNDDPDTPATVSRAAELDTLKGIQNIIGTEYKDTLKGNEQANTFRGGAGDDTLNGGAGDDRLDGGADNDILYGDDGKDTLDGGAGEDEINGGLGDDMLDGGADNDRINGGDGADTLNGGAGDDTLYGNDGKDTLVGGAGVDRINGGDGEDTLIGGAGDDFLWGNEGDDTIDGGAGNENILNGGTGADTYIFRVGDGTDTITEQVEAAGTSIINLRFEGSQYLAADFKSDDANPARFNREEGGDALVISIDKNPDDNIIDQVTINNAYDENNNLRYTINVAYGSEGSFTEIAAAATYWNSSGSENRPFMATAEPNAFTGKTGADWVSYAGSAEGVTIALNDDAAVAVTVANPADGDGNPVAPDTLLDIQNLIGTDQGDTLTGNAQANTLRGGAGVDIISGGGGIDIIEGGADGDTLNGGADGDTIEGGEGVDTINGDGGADTLYGGAGVDTINGGADGDIIEGGAGGDTINGDDGADTLYGGAGVDTIKGGADGDIIEGGADDDKLSGEGGTDTYIFNAGDGADTIEIDADGGKLFFRADVSFGDFSFGRASGDDNVKITVGEDSVEFLPDAYADGRYILHYGTNDEILGALILGVDGTFASGAKEDVIIGTAQADTINSLGGDDTIDGGEGADTLTGGAGADTLDGGDGTDTTSYSSSTKGVRVALSLTDAQQDFTNEYGFAGNDNEAVGDILSNIENIYGSAHADWLTGDALANMLTGGASNDRLEGGAGVDTIDGGAGADTLDGGAGADTYIFRVGDGADSIDDVAGDTMTLRFLGDAYLPADFAADSTRFARNGNNLVITLVKDSITDKVTINDAYDTDSNTGTGDAAFTINIEYGVEGDILNQVTDFWSSLVASGSESKPFLASAAADEFTGSTGADWVSYAYEGAGRVTITLSDDDDALATVDRGAAGDKLTSINNIIGTDQLLGDGLSGNEQDNIFYGKGGGDYLEGNGGNDILYGGADGDDLHGGDGNDILYGGADDDILEGDAGKDTLDGGAGLDDLQGNAGDDTYIFRVGDGVSNEGNSDYILDVAGDTMFVWFYDSATGNYADADFEAADNFNRVGNDLVISIDKDADDSIFDKVTIVNAYNAEGLAYTINIQYGVEGDTLATATDIWSNLAAAAI